MDHCCNKIMGVFCRGTAMENTEECEWYVKSFAVKQMYAYCRQQLGMTICVLNSFNVILSPN